MAAPTTREIQEALVSNLRGLANLDGLRLIAPYQPVSITTQLDRAKTALRDALGLLTNK
jgi:hypothetical protein